MLLRASSAQRPAPLPILEGKVGGGTWSSAHLPAVSPQPLIAGHSSSRLFSLQVPVPPKIFLSLVYKLEGPSAVGVALELTTADAGSCHVGGILALSGEWMWLVPPFLTGFSPLRGSLGEEEDRGVAAAGVQVPL